MKYKGKEYNNSGELIFEGEFKNGYRWKSSFDNNKNKEEKNEEEENKESLEDDTLKLENYYPNKKTYLKKLLIILLSF